jgi:hypothetical protein
MKPMEPMHAGERNLELDLEERTGHSIRVAEWMEEAWKPTTP